MFVEAEMKSVGSIWRKWDLHVHTHASFIWKGGKKLRDQTTAERDDTCKSILERMGALDVDAFCIMDYWTFDGFLELRDYLRRNPTATAKRVFPGIELRLEAPTDYRLNTHILFDDLVSNERLGHFLAHVKLVGPQGRPPSRENFIEIAKSYDPGKLKHHGMTVADRADDEKMYHLGLSTAVVTRESLHQAIEIVGDEHCLIVQPYDTSDGLEDLDWKRHPYTDSTLMKWADMFETRDQLHVDLFLGFGHPKKPSVGEEFIENLGGYPKPVVSGSDAHRIADYGVYPSDRITWLKAQPTFAGLRQVCHEPALRCFIGENPPKRGHIAQNPTKYMQRLHIEKVSGSTLDEHWFDGMTLDLNAGLIAIIGNKGSGKSALADVLALAGNAHCGEMEFLNDKRFRRGINKAAHFKATLVWADETPVEVTLDEDPDTDKPERVRYLPQQFIETLCNEIASGNDTDFDQELKKVIYSHVQEDKRLQKASLDELLDYIVGGHRKAISQLQAKLHSVNTEILGVERELNEDSIKANRTALSLKQTELEAHDKTRPEEVPEPEDDPNNPQAKQITESLLLAQKQLDEFNTKLETAKTERSALVARAALLTRLEGHIANFGDAYKAFIEETTDEFKEGGFNITHLVKLTVNSEPVALAIAETSDKLAELAALMNGKNEEKGLENQSADARVRVDELQRELGAPQRRYQIYLTELNRWQTRRSEIVGTVEKPSTIEFLKTRISNAETILPQRIFELREQRRQRVREIHGELLKIRGVYQELYKPVQDMAATSNFAKESLYLNFDAFLTPSRFEENFLDFIHRNRKGNFYGEDESRKAVRELVKKHDFNSTEEVVAFLDGLMNLLTVIERDGLVEAVTIQSQLKDKKKVPDLYDFLFGLQYVEPRYTLKLGGKDISQLSPGEKGALLLVFYLLLDREEIPIIIDQPEQNLDNESVVQLLVDCIRRAAARRQVVIVTHNPNLAVVCDADQIVRIYIDKGNGNRISYESGAIEDNPINKAAVDVLEGTYRAFDNRRKKYHKPEAKDAPI
jgi:ABC-type lipoprotein export system ATPase subunit